MRPVEPLRLDEHQHVNVIILDDIDDNHEDLHFAPRGEFQPLTDHLVTLETVHAALSKIPGSLDADFLVARNER